MSAGAINVPKNYINKYNKYMDNVFNRINKVLHKNYDPVNVRLQSAPVTKKKNSPSKNSNKSKHKPKKTQKKKNKNKVSGRNDEILLNETISTDSSTIIPETENHRMARKRNSYKKKPKPNKVNKKKKKGEKNNKNKIKDKTSPIRAKATLYGLSTLRRDGDVNVNVLSTYTTVRARFLVGPLTLRVEKEFGETRGSKRQLRSAIATTGEMMGKLNLKVVHGGDATLTSIKVSQPKQLRVDSDDQNENTSDLVWKKSGDLSKMVSQKLLNAARTLLAPLPGSDRSALTFLPLPDLADTGESSKIAS